MEKEEIESRLKLVKNFTKNLTCLIETSGMSPVVISTILCDVAGQIAREFCKDDQVSIDYLIGVIRDGVHGTENTFKEKYVEQMAKNYKPQYQGEPNE